MLIKIRLDLGIEKGWVAGWLVFAKIENWFKLLVFLSSKSPAEKHQDPLASLQDTEI